jgi:hypothetical protein
MCLVFISEFNSSVKTGSLPQLDAIDHPWRVIPPDAVSESIGSKVGDERIYGATERRRLAREVEA